MSQIEQQQSQARTELEQISRVNAQNASREASPSNADASPDYIFEFGDNISFGDREVSEAVDPSVLAKMPHKLDVTDNNTPLRHRLYCSKPILHGDQLSVRTGWGHKLVELTARGVIVHDAGDHAPIWLEPGVYEIGVIQELDPFTNEVVAVFD